MNQKITSTEEASRIAEFQLAMALQTQSLELNGPLVRQAVAYLIRHPESGFYLANRSPTRTITGSLLTTFQNPSSWWIQSVFVDKQFRRQGIFTNLFKELATIAKQNNVKVVSLYAEESNTRALSTYCRLGMHVTKQVIYGYDIMYSPEGINKLRQSCKTENTYSFNENQKQPALQSWINVLGTSPSGNIVISGFNKNGQQILYAQYFEEFSDWRFGKMIYISTCLVRNHQDMEDILQHLCLHIIRLQSDLKIQAIRFLGEPQESAILLKILPGIDKLHYLMVRMHI